MSSHTTEARPKEILLVGLGAVGSIYAFLLEKSGLARVTAVARSNYDLYATSGVTLDTTAYGRIEKWSPFKVVRSLEEALASGTIYDYVVLSTKCLPDVKSNSALLAPVLESKQAKAIALIQNGLNIERDLYEWLEARGLENEIPIVSLVVWVSISTSADGSLVTWSSAPLHTALGLYPPPETTQPATGGPDALQNIADLLSNTRMPVTITTRIDSVRFMKNVVNCVWSSIEGLTRATPEHFAALPGPLVEIIKSLIREIVLTGFKSGLLSEGMIQLPGGSKMADPESLISSTWSFVVYMAVTAVKSGRQAHKMSLMVDVENERPIEFEVIVGSVLRVAREHKVPTPLLTYTYAL